MGVVASCVLTFAALVCFALSLRRHHRQVFGGPTSKRRKRLFQGLAVALLVAAPAPWMAQQGATMAFVTWIFCGTPLAGLGAVALFTGLDLRARR